MGGQDILRRFLTFFFWVQTWQFGFYRKKRQRERPPVMTIRSSASSYRRGDVLHIILTWASCLAYLCRRQPRPVPRVSKSMTPTSFFCTRSGRAVTGQKITICTTIQPFFVFLSGRYGIFIFCFTEQTTVPCSHP